MPLFPNPLESVAFRLSVVPPMLADYFGVLGFHSLVAGARLGVFDALPASADDLAAKLQLDPRGTHALLRSLTGLGYLRVRRGRYHPTRPARLWLRTDSPSCLVEGFDFWERSATALWANLDKTIRTGQPATSFYALTENDPELSRSFQAWTAALARRQGPAIARAIRVHRDARDVLDVGGSHTIHSTELLRLHPSLHATIIDLPEALNSAVIEEPFRSRITLWPASFLEADLGEGYDVALLFNIVHGLSDAEAADLLARVAKALNPGGTIVVGDQFRGATAGRASRTLLDLLDLNYLLAIGGRIRTYPEVAAMLADAGFAGVRHRRPLRSPATELVVARR
ncbi:methyltransferase [Nonomuraea sp. NPDC050556]|uniref:methyltransferase n=1 Tax=Nonomuraea sp. NPDC050556 TaxID=3364369 RepID=UPI0037A3EEF2